MKKAAANKPVNRRELLRMAGTVGGLAAVSSILEACSKAGLDLSSTPPNPTEPPAAISPTMTDTISQDQPAPTAPVDTATAQTIQTTSPLDTNSAVLAFVKTNDRSDGVRKAIDALGINPVAGKRVFLKPNFNSADATPGSTHPHVLSTLVQRLKEMGAGKITVGDRSGMGDTRQVMRNLGVIAMAEELGFEFVVLENLSKEDWVMCTPAGSHWKTGFPFARPCLEAEALVQTCCLKTHRFGGHFTMSLKNSVGMVASNIPSETYDYMNELHGSRNQRLMIAEINTVYSPALVVMDGVEAFISGGPDRGEKVSSQVVLAGTDRIAIDAVGVALLRHHGCRTEAARGNIFEQEQIARAAELGLGVKSPENIQLITPDPESAAYAEQIQSILSQG